MKVHRCCAAGSCTVGTARFTVPCLAQRQRNSNFFRFQCAAAYTASPPWESKAEVLTELLLATGLWLCTVVMGHYAVCVHTRWAVSLGREPFIVVEMRHI